MFEKKEQEGTTLSASARAAGLNQIAEIRALYWGDDGKALARFFECMRNREDPQKESNHRALAALFWLANIPSTRHGCRLDELSKEERKALILAMNRIRAMVSLFPQRLTMPL